MSIFSKYIVLIFLSTVTSLAFAINWVSVGEGKYVDLDSKKSQGDLASIMFRGVIAIKTSQSISWVGGNYAIQVEFDCKRKVITNLYEEVKVIPETPEAEALKHACTWSYKFWK